ncbi:hypothetical protein [Flavobacterium sp. K5-23]|uniref:hypothetical protein n=1 Tax=Flavobacterium sp. K5-23 TaxID=2746225 RepID=UPI00200D4392|nr:hypothetical protein [Flavobacterium sp. K5-23]UQD55848.1 hypothetical protein FLAK523_05325 [Flavobacterium sp. K5-23]
MKILGYTESYNDESKFSDTNNGYYLVSIKWSVLNDEYITFIRKSAIAYCYNLDWAGPKSKFELEQYVKKEETIIVHHSLIQPFLIKCCVEKKDCFMLPNTDEVRKVIGFKNTDLQLVI